MCYSMNELCKQYVKRKNTEKDTKPLYCRFHYMKYLEKAQRKQKVDNERGK